MENLIPRLCKFIDIEYDTEIASTDQLWKLPLEERVTKGEAIQNLKAQFITMAFGGSKMVIGVHFTCDSNISKFREGTPVIVSGHGIKFKGEITSEERNSIEIGMNQFDGYPSVPEHLLKSSGWVIDKAKTDIRHILKQPIQNLPLNTSRYNLINGILDGSILPELDELARSKAEQLAMAAMAAGTKFIFIGDHKQLPPIISPQQQDVELSKSIFEYLFKRYDVDYDISDE